MKLYTSEPRRTGGGLTKVGIADRAVARDDAVIVTSGLGSCVGIALADTSAAIIGLAHAMLPSHRPDGAEAKFVDSTTRALVAEMDDRGADIDRIVAKLAGGSRMFEFTTAGGNVGQRNVDAARQTLDGLDIPVVADDVGGSHGRSLEFRGPVGELRIRSAAAGEKTI